MFRSEYVRWANEDHEVLLTGAAYCGHVRSRRTVSKEYVGVDRPLAVDQGHDDDQQDHPDQRSCTPPRESWWPLIVAAGRSPFLTLCGHEDEDRAAYGGDVRGGGAVPEEYVEGVGVPALKCSAVGLFPASPQPDYRLPGFPVQSLTRAPGRCWHHRDLCVR